MNGYQLNLVWREGHGAVKRQFLTKQAVRGFVVRLGCQYESLFGFLLRDNSRTSQPDDAAHRGQAPEQ